MSKEDLIQEIVENIARCQRPANLADWQKIGLPHSQVSMLFMLSYHKQLQIKQIAGFLGVTKSAASQMMESITNKGLASRQTDLKDRRIVRFSLTPKGVQALKKIHKFKFAGMRSRLESLSSQDLNALADISRKMSIAVKEN
jgi:DNA-binding MarR family transcriptional regulator